MPKMPKKNRYSWYYNEMFALGYKRAPDEEGYLHWVHARTGKRLPSVTYDRDSHVDTFGQFVAAARRFARSV